MGEPKIVELHRLSREEYDKLTKGLPQGFVDSNTSPQQAGFLLGIQYVLAKLREGVVIG